ncbi:hypothetical protein AM1_G0036 (plasmid) [Acaryochloris marina MBIC11017]|uniref:Uncharacterized protein n=1 Tax=Acaryochloris marina (strain MBIC 11017) TaxID=329726 RepID=A8ZQD0_ACAM1|nr:hypothetical protein AM1_G0036 [Acaryochloris marina MBIC11017]
MISISHLSDICHLAQKVSSDSRENPTSLALNTPISYSDPWPNSTISDCFSDSAIKVLTEVSLVMPEKRNNDEHFQSVVI